MSVFGRRQPPCHVLTTALVWSDSHGDKRVLDQRSDACSWVKLGVASTAAGRGPRLLALVRGPAKDQPVPAVVRCRERRQDVAPVEGLVYQHP